MTEKRFYTVHKGVYDELKRKELHHGEITSMLNALHDENEQLKEELNVYRKLANCKNCEYHNYDTLFGGDEEYEVCDKGNDVTDGICKDWREL